ncbi:MAG: sensor domain-containing diguanylate cyclase [Pseudodesulfovibrio sp.]|uniref:Diguanylate cyclase n=1 Tax=Pseudodesulfovibrio aespoeensis (strain ATCC 700646 / DSM 10631 / Aspo-2) TaxID=643562 RepID=E6VYS7_PSEA9|nr:MULTISPECIES: sensor domain-containing diguanylate cyclase [Pseudodesulfovibrio]MBU4379284.1 sensor domain-containing diguanylate cyclase [Pseudomonadota bacterium]ADU63944.1 diguanylate cyclase [Pseudodesulfovibrio aespoeensis Aspo-2]MBU4474386.1 sensor domain-containing diguanylate cyclase [Pseudomonadota bacterium]MBU4517031.1 sensor domain-containing diguanylate cyclase [Pseudomonadota bacterium]MBU4523282.1 sensor domain-containing diguanylate cyclase [Pseudomonadota bacterium]
MNLSMDVNWLLNECSDPYTLERLFYVERYAWLSLSPDMCAVISIDGQFEDVNTHWERTTGISREKLQGAYLIEHIHFDDRERALADMQRLITSDIGSTTFSFRFLCKGERHVELNWNVIFSPDHNAYFCTVLDPARDADRLAYTDVLTGLKNRLALGRDLPSVLAQAQEADSRVAVLFIDLDGFKAVNDTLGHKAGDTLLVRAARRMNYVVGQQGDTYRPGGDEFVVVIPKADRDIVAGIAGQLVERLRAQYIIENKRVNTGASLGIALYPTDGETAEKLMEAADRAMYLVKRGGKNNFAFHIDGLGDEPCLD